jgi:hypothetical protein
MASITFRSSTPDRLHPQGCGSRAGSSNSMYSHNLSGVRQSGWAFSRSSGVSATPAGEHFSLQNSIRTACWN